MKRPSTPSLSAYIRIYSKVEDYETYNKTQVDTEFELERKKNGGSLDFNFISSPNPTVNEN